MSEQKLSEMIDALEHAQLCVFVKGAELTGCNCGLWEAHILAEDLEERLAEFENDETRTRRELALRNRQLVELADWFELKTGHERPSWAPKKESV